jgi:RNA polymerase-interacting CarD/CdnL/TRCF family regulator
MAYAIGDTVIHWNHGMGTVIAIDQMDLAGVTQQYYVVKVNLLKLWVPFDGAQDGAIRLPTDRMEFKGLFEILRQPGKHLPENQYQRKIELRGRMQKMTLESICHVIRDLTDRATLHTLNQHDAAVLFRAEEHLLDEWVISLEVERSDALSALEVILHGNPVVTTEGADS